jgi:bifunctional non-homologous end joining protein LigD
MVGVGDKLDKLDRYRAMRDFGATPEPAGAPVAGGDGEGEGSRFVVQQHSATRLHWDLRLERDGVLVSWACPRGIPHDPKRNNLAVHTEDHPLEYLDFHGEIPEGSYGAGNMTVWDTGTYETLKWEDREVMVTFHGSKVQGTYVLFQTRDRDWMIHRMDPPQDPERQPLPSGLRPMLPVEAPLPGDEEAWGFEVRWDGLRALLTSEQGTVGIVDAGGRPYGDQLPEIRRIGRAIGSLEVVLDGEVVALHEGRPDADRLARRLAAGDSDSRIRRLARDAPSVFMAFDLLWLEGHSTMALPYRDRRTLLDEMGLAGEAWQTPPSHAGVGSALVEAVRAQRLPGVLAKRLESPYRPGERSDDWRSIDA